MFSAITFAQVNEIKEEFWEIEFNNVSFKRLFDLNGTESQIFKETGFTVEKAETEEDPDFKYKSFTLTNGIILRFHTPQGSSNSYYSLNGIEFTNPTNFLTFNNQKIQVGDSISKFGNVLTIDNKEKGFVSFSPDIRTNCFLAIDFDLQTKKIIKIKYYELIF